jgi:hypothetical protein
MPNINVSIISGHAGRPAQEVKNKDGTKTWYELSLPWNLGYGDYLQTHWVRCKAFGKVGEYMAKKTSKGDFVSVTGKFEKIEPKKDGKPGVNITFLVSEFNWICKPTKLQNLDIIEFDLPENNSDKKSDVFSDGIPF